MSTDDTQIQDENQIWEEVKAEREAKLTDAPPVTPEEEISEPSDVPAEDTAGTQEAIETPPSDDPTPIDGQNDAEAPPEDVQRLRSKMRDLGGRYGREKQKREALEAEMQALRAQLDDTPDAPLLDDTAISDIREDYPEIADKLIPAVEGRLKQVVETVEHRLAPQLTQLQTTQAEQDFARRQSELTAQHPDWEAVVQGQDYADWLDGQPAGIQVLARESAEVADAAFILDQFKNSSSDLSVAEATLNEPISAPENPKRAAQLVAGASAPKTATQLPEDEPTTDEALWASVAAERARRKANRS